MRTGQWKWVLLVVGIGISAGTAMSVWAADYDKGMSAASRGDYAAALAEFKPPAEQGDAPSQYKVGTLYASGVGIPLNKAEAVKWYRRSAEQGYDAAEFNLGVAYANGEGVPKDYQQAARWYEKAAAQGNEGGLVNLGHLYALGQGVRRDHSKALALWGRAAELGSADTAYRLGMTYHIGKGVPVNFTEARRFYAIAVKNDDNRALVKLGQMASKGEGAPKNEAEAMRLFAEAAKFGNLDGQYEMALRYANGMGVPKDVPHAIQLYRAAGDKNHAPSLRNLATMYLAGTDVSQDEAQAVALYRRAAIAGEVKSQMFMATASRFGLMGFEQDFTQAVKWYQQAADNGDGKAAGELADMFASGEGVQRDPQRAVFLFLQAAEFGGEINPERIKALLPGVPKISVANSSITLRSDNELDSREVYRARRGEVGYVLWNGADTTGWIYLYFADRAQAGWLKTPGGWARAGINEIAATPDRPVVASVAQPIQYADHCYNGDCVRTFPDGRKVRFQAQYCYDGLEQQWSWKPDGC